MRGVAADCGGEAKVPWRFAQANAVLGEDGEAGLRVYDATNEGIVESFVERDV